MKNKPVIFARLLLLVFILAGLAYIAMPFLNPRTPETSTNTIVAENAPVNFRKQGALSFIQDGRTIKRIDIELAATSEARNQGLMYRPSLPDSAGMLFIFEEPAPRVFWMKNTIIPLDIVYIDANKKIVSISKNTVPYSEESVASVGNAQYVLEVNAGFTTNHQIKAGDAISF